MLTIFTGCSQTTSNNEISDDTKLNVVSTIFPGFDFTREIALDYVELTMLLSPGSETHSFEPAPKDIITIQNCDVFIYVGGESDVWVDKILDSMDISDMKIIAMMDLVDTVEEEIIEGMEDDHVGEERKDDDEDNHGDEETEYDEYVWTSPLNVIKITRAITSQKQTLNVI